MGASKCKWRRGLTATALLMGLTASLSPAGAYAKDDVEARLRGALRQATAQLRDLEDQNAALQAKQAEADRQKQDLTDKLAADEKELNVLRQRNEAEKNTLKQTSSKLETTEGNLEKWEAAYKEAADVARGRDADIKKLDAEAKRRDAALVQTREMKHACEDKNAALYKLGEQLLDLYDQKGVFDALAAGEPVTQLKRVEYENIMQDYEDKLRASEIVPPQQ